MLVSKMNKIINRDSSFPRTDSYATIQVPKNVRDIESENMRILKRLQNQKSVYNVEQWDKHRKSVERILVMR
jgi:hypothetical protein